MGMTAAFRIDAICRTDERNATQPAYRQAGDDAQGNNAGIIIELKQFNALNFTYNRRVTNCIL